MQDTKEFKGFLGMSWNRFQTDSCSNWRTSYRRSHRRCSMEKGVLKYFAKFTRKYLYESHLCNEVDTCNFIKKEQLAQLFSCEFCEISKNTFFTEPLWTNAHDPLTKSLSNWAFSLKCSSFQFNVLIRVSTRGRDYLIKTTLLEIAMQNVITKLNEDTADFFKKLEVIANGIFLFTHLFTSFYVLICTTTR